MIFSVNSLIEHEDSYDIILFGASGMKRCTFSLIGILMQSILINCYANNQTASYDAVNGLLILPDVEVLTSQQHFYVELQQQKDSRFKLVKLQLLSVITLANSAQYDEDSKTLNIFSVIIKNNYYTAKLKYTGDFVFELVASTQKLPKRFTKISNNGKALPDEAKLGNGENDWACTRDNKTSLIWEIKTDDEGLRDKDWGYTWYNSDLISNGGFSGYGNDEGLSKNCVNKSNCNTEDYVRGVDALGLCGSHNWRLPSLDELLSLVYCSEGKNADFYCAPNSLKPTIDPDYFPNSRFSIFWSSTSAPDDPNYSWGVFFTNGSKTRATKDIPAKVRLVREEL